MQRRLAITPKCTRRRAGTVVRCIPDSWCGVAAVLLLLPAIAWSAVKIDIEGVESSVAENIRLHLARFEDLPLADVQAVEKRLRRPVTQALEALGYYHAKVDYSVRDSQLRLQIEPGAPVEWGAVDIRVINGRQGPDSAISKRVAQHPFTRGARINHGVYETFKRELLSLAQRQGYLDAAFAQHRMRINPATNRAAITLELKLGERYRVGEITFSGSDISPDLLRRLSELEPGETYNADKVGELYNRLMNSGYFAAVNVDTQPRPPDRLDIAVQLTDAPSHRYSAGVGFGTDTGPRVQLSWYRPRVNRRGDSFQADLEASQISQELSAQYKIPWDHPLQRYLVWRSGWQEKRVEDTDSRLITTGLAYHNLVEGGWQSTYHIDLERETFQQGSEPEKTVTHIVPGGHWSRTVVEGPGNNPDWGYKFWFGVQASSTVLGSDTDFVRVAGGLRYLTTWLERHQLVARLEGGAIYSGVFADVPASRRFFTGGDQSVRGYAYESIAPEDDQGELTGGRFLNVASLEYRWLWRPEWQWAVFTDTGRAYNESGEPFETSVGVGLRWRTPVGVVAFDVAQPIDSEREDSVRLHIYLGLPL